MNCMQPLLPRGAKFVTPAGIQCAVSSHMDLEVAPSDRKSNNYGVVGIVEDV